MSVALNRRRFLFGLCGLAAATPFAGMAIRRTRAAGGNTARRLIIFFSPNGTVHQHWRPQGGGNDFSFSAGSILEPLTAIKDDLIVVDGLNFFQADNHEGGMAAMLTAGGSPGSESGGMSVDQYVAANLGAQTQFKSLEYGVQTSPWGGNIQTRMSYSAPGQFMTPDDNPSSMFQRMFGDLLGGDDAALKLRARRQRVVDLLTEETTALRTRLDNAEKHKLDAHLEALAAVENSLQNGGTCDVPVAPMDLNPVLDANFPAVTKAQLDMMLLGLECDMTRVASIQLSHTVSPTVMSWAGTAQGHHTLSHTDDNNTQSLSEFVACERWCAEQFAYIVDALKAKPEPDGEGTMLDNSVVVWAKEMGDSRAHVCTDVPFVIAGNACGRWETGRYLSFDGDSHSKLLVSLCHAMGLDNDTFGNPEFSSGPLAGLE